MRNLFLALLTLSLGHCAPAFAQDNSCNYVAGLTKQAFDECASELALKAPLASPALTGNPTAPTASPGDADTSIASTGFVAAAVAALSGTYAPLVHVHAIADVTGLTAALAAKLDASVVSAFGLTLIDDADATTARSTLGLGTAAVSAIGDFAAASHTHTAAAITDFASAVAALITGKADLASPTFTGTVTLPAGQVVNGVTLTGAGASTDYLSADGTYSTPAGGGDGWVYLILAADTVITTTTYPADLQFAPPANSAIEIEAIYILGSSVSGDAARLEVSWPSGVDRSAGWMEVVSSNTGTAGAASSAYAGGTFTQQSTTPNATYLEYLGTFRGLLITGASPSGNFQLGARGETANAITIYKNSFIRYRVQPAL